MAPDTKSQADQAQTGLRKRQAAQADDAKRPLQATAGLRKPVPQAAKIPTFVVAKLLFFTVLMFSLPLATFFYGRDALFDGNATYSAIAAAIMANIVLFAFVLAAFAEDQGPAGNEQKSK
ncbi:uncharacterized protein BJ171DRAFT_601986 [Polychytrium aggregatum]|uniref:uncharacterized protein n=1 Tax=Polychytrium aggregatum TaxID=110093 RepID=UPI0022FE12C4|nr:uncharacterized protein BJ171DRAFT_601986 [Polychytrium aggregatum]KAI9199201.1 hypothetical protein BJ171DRAFT_601986 [Polychytrium aggregatum]